MMIMVLVRSGAVGRAGGHACVHARRSGSPWHRVMRQGLAHAGAAAHTAHAAPTLTWNSGSFAALLVSSTSGRQPSMMQMACITSFTPAGGFFMTCGAGGRGVCACLPHFVPWAGSS